jgi:hypothetical protein
MGVKISNIATENATPTANDRIEISRLLSSGPDVWETQYIDWADILAIVNGELDLDEVVTNGDTYAGTMIKATTSNNNALVVVNSYMNIGAGDSADLDGSANRYAMIAPYSTTGNNQMN